MALWLSLFILPTGHSCSSGLEQRQAPQSIALFVKVMGSMVGQGLQGWSAMLQYPNLSSTSAERQQKEASSLSVTHWAMVMKIIDTDIMGLSVD